jgi:predicted  nucleic acid-binding Zn-ribbon protein
MDSMAMANPHSAGTDSALPTLDAALANTLKLQSADVVRQQLETQLKQVPVELAELTRSVALENATFEDHRKAAQMLEVERKDIDNRRKTAEAQVFKFKTQQGEVRKNDEYQALTHQIETAEAEVSTLESEELQQMIKIDEATVSLRAAETEHKRRLAELEGQIALVRQKEAECKARLEAQTGAVEAAAAVVPPIWRRAYDTAKARAKRAPYIVPMDDHRCGGCRLRLSNEVAEGARHGGKPVCCDSCGRVVYLAH